MRFKPQRYPVCRTCGEPGHRSRKGIGRESKFSWMHFDDKLDKDHKFMSDDRKVPDFIRW